MLWLILSPDSTGLTICQISLTVKRALHGVLLCPGSLPIVGLALMERAMKSGCSSLPSKLADCPTHSHETRVEEWRRMLPMTLQLEPRLFSAMQRHGDIMSDGTSPCCPILSVPAQQRLPDRRARLGDNHQAVLRRDTVERFVTSPFLA